MKLFSSAWQLCQKHFLLSLIVFFTCDAANAEGLSMAKYGEVVEYKANEAIQYPDFTITYQGRTHEASPVFKNGFNYQNFIVSSPQGEAKIRWTSGTGEISETRFLVDGKKFYLDVAPRKDGLYIKRTQPILIVHDEEHYQSYRK